MTILTTPFSRRTFVMGAAGVTAMAACWGIAGSSWAAEPPQTATPYGRTEEADLIVVGAGGAGLAAAVAAVDAGARRVIVLESQGRTGGSLNLTSGTMSCAESVIQAEDGIEDSVDSFVADIMATGGGYGGKPTEELVRMFAENDIPMFQWLWDHGLSEYEFRTDAEGRRAVFAPEHELYSVARSYKTSARDRTVYASAAHEVIDTYVQSVDAIEIAYRTEAVELVASENRVVGVVAVDAQGEGTLYLGERGVVMCTGGYGANRKLLERYDEQGAYYLIGCGPWSTGRGLQMMQKMGGTLVNMDAIPTFPMGLESRDQPGHGDIASTYMWKGGGICVNKNGERFMNENDPSPSAREEALVAQPEAIQYDIFTDKIVADLAERKEAFFYQMFYEPEDSKGHHLVHAAATLEELAQMIGVPADALTRTVEAYNASVESGETDEFGRTYDDAFSSYKSCNNTIEGDRYYGVPIKALNVMTLGGIRCDTQLCVLDERDQPIPGLYAGGEVVGGVWGKFVSGGTGVMGALTLGHVAAAECMEAQPVDGYTVRPASEVLSDELFEVEKPTELTFEVAGDLVDGTYETTVGGQDGPLTIAITVEDGTLTACEVIGHAETAAIGGQALPELMGQVVAAGGPQIDGVAGATLTSNRVRSAVAECLEAAQA